MGAAAEKYLGELLVRRGALDPERLGNLLRTASERNLSLFELLESNRDISSESVLKAIAEELGLSFCADPKFNEIPSSLVEAVPITFARQYKVLPYAFADPDRPERSPIRVLTANPLNPAPLDDLQALFGRPIVPVVATSEAIEDAINRVYERKDENVLGEAREEAAEELQDLIDMTDEAPVIRWVNNLFYTAAQRGASDIHIEPGEREVIVRYRVDGNLQVVKTAHKGFLNSIISRVKIEAGLNIAEKRLPQDGRITKRIQGRLIDVRVSTIPTSKGESVVMRLLDKEKMLLDLSELGFSGAHLACIHYLISRPNGIVLVTGPTGSGKTTTLYAALSKINTPDLKILTAEDPVEYELPGIGQLQVQPKIGLTFASALRAFLRQDPDVIMVGEIRDHETAEIAIHASLTGHLVFSTLHTNEAAGSVTRLVEMGVEPYLITSSLIGVVAQRLVRRLCPYCKEPYLPTEQDFRQLGVDRQRLHQVLNTPGVQPWPGMPIEYMASEQNGDRGNGNRNKEWVFFKPRGCEACSGIGYRGRIAIAEILLVDDAVRREILNRADANQITKTAASRGMRTLREDGARVVAQGITSLEEVLAATQAGDME
ncbi:MAG: ATPase, T2SS/T4P/T4SS family [Sandaracinaceae bacterium]|nr:ATPase, T2SS/T4P/T4SS family [Sandaracinaceae bacterium]